MFFKILRSPLIWFCALGYFVDLYDLVLFGVVRQASLKDLGLNDQEIFETGSSLLNIQMLGLLLGGLLWGILADRFGRLRTLTASIILYSSATFLNAFSNSIETYALCRFFSGIGLAGELGAAVTLSLEAMPASFRGMGPAWIASIGFMGAAMSSILNQWIHWRMAYALGGALGFALIFARLRIQESTLYLETKKNQSALGLSFGNVLQFFYPLPRFIKFFLLLLIGIPIWYVAGILGYFAPELAKELGVVGEVKAGNVIFLGYAGSIVGDIACGLLSQKLKSRKKSVFIFMLFGALTALLHPFFLRGTTSSLFELSRFLIGFSNGYIALLVVWAGETFGTNLRGSATILISNLIRGSLILLTLMINALRPKIGLTEASLLIGLAVYLFALVSTLLLKDTFSNKLQFEEK